MSLQLKPIHPLFAAEASGIDIASPLAKEDIAAIDAAMDKYAVLVFRNQPLDQDQQIAFCNSFGPLDLGLLKVMKRPTRFKHEAMIDIANVNLNGEVLPREDRKNISNFANQFWHSDSSFQQTKAAYSMLSAVTLPSWGGDTEYADLRAAYDALPEGEKKELEGLVAQHYALYSRMMLGDNSYTEEQKNAIPPARWPLVMTHPTSGRKLLFVGIHTTHIESWPLAEGRMRLAELLEHATQRQFVYTHKWQVGDLVIWDNRATLHRGRRYDIAEKRELRRTTTEDLISTMPDVEQKAA